MAKNKSVYLIDGSAMFYRAFFAFIRNPLINSKGEDTSATFGFVNSILSLIDNEKPDYIAVAFDTKEPTFRHDMYDEYKSTRAKMPEELVEQLPRIKESVEALNLASFEMVGYEADDIIGTIATEAAGEGCDVWLVTGDKDFFQLVNEKIKVYNPKNKSGEIAKMGPEEVKTKFGVYPELVIDKLALMGDSSDNVPGIPGIGPKTADKLLDQFGSLEKILENHLEIKAKGVREKVANNIESATLSKELVTIKCDMDIGFKLEDIKRREYNFEKAKKLFTELEFNRILKQVCGESSPDDTASEKETQKPKADYHTIVSLEMLKNLVKELSTKKEIAVDTETTSVNALEADIVGISLSEKAGSGYYIPLKHIEEANMNLPFDEAIKIIKPLLENKKVQKIGQNIKYDYQIFHHCGIELNPISFDTMIGAYVLDPSLRDKSLSYLALKHFDYTMQPISDLIGSGKKQITFDKVPVSKASFYAAEDADYTYRLRGVMAPKIDQLGMQNLFYNIEMPLVKVLSDMEEEGIKIDVRYLSKMSKDMEKKLDKLIEEIYDMAGGEFNINSTQQLSHILFEKMNLPTKGKTAKKTGYSTDVKVLEELARIHDFPKLILDYRQLTKLKSTYVDAIPKLVSEKTDRVHTSFNQTIAATGRLSSTDPNLQNIPIRTEEGRLIRKAFIPRDNDYLILTADYSQVELRILAHYADDKGLIKAFKAEEDIHSRTAAEVYGVDIKNVTSEQRRAAKTANFAIIYGVTAYGLSQQSELSVDEAGQFIKTYFDRYPGIRDYMENMKQFARENGYVTTYFKRRRYLPEIKAKNYNIRQFAERTAINTPIQGTAADLIKVAMIKIAEKLNKYKSKLVLQVHDELVLDVYKEELDEVSKILKHGMENAVKLKVPLTVDLGSGPNWLDAK